MEGTTFVATVWSPEPLVSFCLKTSGLYTKEKVESYQKFLGTRFHVLGGIICRQLSDLLSAFAWATPKNVMAGLQSLAGDFRIDGDNIKYGEVRIPKPGGNLWQGTKYSFKNKKALTKAINHVKSEGKYSDLVL